MTPYLILVWSDGDAQATALVRLVRTKIGTPHSDWRLLLDRPGALIAIGRNGRAITTRTQGPPTIIIGDVFPRLRNHGATESLLAANLPFSELCTQLASDYWGAYVAVQIRGCGDISLFRDPIGMRDGVSWEDSGVRVFASEAMPWLTVSAPSRLTIDWNRIAELLLDSSTVSEATPLMGVDTIPAGSLVDICEGRTMARRLWSPCEFYERRGPSNSDVADLREAVIRCTRAWVETYPSNILEISGGFDSAVVAAAGITTAAGMQRGVNFFTDHLSGDERQYARDISAQCGVALDEVFMPVGRLGEGDLEDVPVGVRPGLSTATLFHDRPLTRIAAEHGANALFTGHGGDSVFFQHPTAMIAADPSFPRSDFHAYTALAKWSKESTWTVAAYALQLPLPRQVSLPEYDAVVTLPIHGDPSGCNAVGSHCPVCGGARVLSSQVNTRS